MEMIEKKIQLVSYLTAICVVITVVLNDQLSWFTTKAVELLTYSPREYFDFGNIGVEAFSWICVKP